MPMNLALAWASVGDANRALEWLARESFRVYWTPQAVWWDPRFDRIRDDARFVRVEERSPEGLVTGLEVMHQRRSACAVLLRTA